MAGKLQLAITGAQDQWLTGAPEISYFTSIFKRHSQFSTEAVEIPLSGDVKLGSLLKCRIPNNVGDLVRSTVLKLEMDTLVGSSNLYNTSIGTHVIQYADLKIGGQTIERITGDFIYMYNQVYNNTDETDTTLYYLTSHNRLSNPSTELYVHLPFYFFRNPNLAIPVCAITKQLVEIDIKFRDVDDDVSFTYTASNSINKRKRTTDGGIKNASIITDFYFISEDERNFLLTRPIEYLITQLQVSKLVYKPNESKKSALLKFKNPVKEMFFMAKEEYSENPYQIEWYQIGTDLNGTGGESFGSSVAMTADGKRIAVGAMNHNSNDGEVRVYDNIDGQWTQVGSSIPGAPNERFGQSISISSDGMRVAVGAAWNAPCVIKVYEYSGSTWNKILEKFGDATPPLDQFGRVISISSDGRRVAAGAPSYGNNQGYVRVYDIDSGTELLEIMGLNSNDYFGSSVSLNSDGTRLVVGADQYQNGNGYVRTYIQDEGSVHGFLWHFMGSQISGKASGDRFGYASSMSSNGNRIAVGAYLNSTSRGYVRIYEYSGSPPNWNQIGSDLEGDSSHDIFGFSVSLSSNGKRVIIGGPMAASNDRGVVKVYEETGGNWNQVFSTIEGGEYNGSGDMMGRNVSMSSDGNVIVAGSGLARSQSGKVVVYTCVVLENRLLDTTTNDQALTPSSVTIPGTNTYQIDQVGAQSQFNLYGGLSFGQGDRFGHSIAISSNGTRMAASSINWGSSRGYVKVFNLSGSTWSQIGSNLSGANANDVLGFSVSMNSDGTRVATGAPGHNNVGKVQIFEESGSIWSQIGSDINGSTSGDEFGNSVSLSPDGTRVAIGAPYNDTNGNGSGQVKVYEYSAPPPNSISITNNYPNALTTIANYNGGSFGTVSAYPDSIRLTSGYSNNNGIWFPVTFGSVWSVSYEWWAHTHGADDMRFNFYAPNQPTSGYASQHGGYYVFHEFYVNDEHDVRRPDDTSLQQQSTTYPNSTWQTVTIDYNNGTLTMSVSGGSGINNKTYTFTGTDLSNQQALWGTNTYICISGRTGGVSATQYIRNLNVSWQDPNTWTQVGSNINGEAAYDLCGRSVSLSNDGTRLAIGAPANNPGSNAEAGHVRVYSESNGQWTQVGSDIDGQIANEASGSAVSLSSDGTRVAIGSLGWPPPPAPAPPVGTEVETGIVRVYSESNGQWTQVGSDIIGEAAGDQSGLSLDLSSDGTRLVIGGSRNDGNGNNSGHTRIFEESGGIWSQIGPDINGVAAGDRSGFSVAMASDGTKVAIGSPYNDGSGTPDAGLIQSYSITGTSTPTQTTNIILSGKRSDYRLIKNIKFACNGETIFDQNGQYLAYEQSLRHHTGCPSPVYEFYMYSFSIQPEMYYPTGQLNMSRIIHKKIDVELEDVSTTSKTNLSIYAQNYNVLHIESGLAGLKF